MEDLDHRVRVGRWSVCLSCEAFYLRTPAYPGTVYLAWKKTHRVVYEYSENRSTVLYAYINSWSPKTWVLFGNVQVWYDNGGNERKSMPILRCFDTIYLVPGIHDIDTCSWHAEKIHYVLYQYSEKWNAVRTYQVLMVSPQKRGCCSGTIWWRWGTNENRCRFFDASIRFIHDTDVRSITWTKKSSRYDTISTFDDLFVPDILLYEVHIYV